MSKAPYDKQAVIADLAARVLNTSQIASKYNITIGNVYTIRMNARKIGLLSGSLTIGERLADELSVFTPILRERIKDMREQDLTSTEISQILKEKGIHAPVIDVMKVMARGASDFYDVNMGIS